MSPNSDAADDGDDFYGVMRFRREHAPQPDSRVPSGLSSDGLRHDQAVGSSVVNRSEVAIRSDDSVFQKYRKLKGREERPVTDSMNGIAEQVQEKISKSSERAAATEQSTSGNSGSRFSRRSRSTGLKQPSVRRSSASEENYASASKRQTSKDDKRVKDEAGEPTQSSEDGQVGERARKAIDEVLHFREMRIAPLQPARNGIHVQVIRDSKGYRMLKYDANELESYTEDELVDVLLRSIVHEDERCFVLNKPSGIETIQSTSRHSIESLLSRFADRLNRQRSTKSRHGAKVGNRPLTPISSRNSSGAVGETDPLPAIGHLSLVHRLDRQTTGCLLIAKDSEAFSFLKAYFAERRIVKRYLCVVRGKPTATEGCIDVPVGPACIGGIERMFAYPQAGANDPRFSLVTRFHDSGKLSRGAIRAAVTNFRVLDSNNGASLIECEPHTGIRHQVRVHMSYVLECPILGDHKYSHVTKLAPQKLNTQMLRALNMRQAKVRSIPLHLHASSLCLPQYYGDARSLHVHAPLHDFFRRSLKWLKLSAK